MEVTSGDAWVQGWIAIFSLEGFLVGMVVLSNVLLIHINIIISSRKFLHFQLINSIAKFSYSLFTKTFANYKRLILLMNDFHKENKEKRQVIDNITLAKKKQLIKRLNY